MTSNPPPQPPATLQELAAAIESLTTEEKLRLSRRSKQLFAGTAYGEGKELLNEAVVRAMNAAAGALPGEHARAWPKHVPLVAFLMKTMQGLASDSHKSAKQKAAQRTEELADEEGADNPALGKEGHAHPSVDEELIERQEREARERQAEADASLIKAHFAQDQEVLDIIEGEMEGWSAEDMRLNFGMSKTTYDTARKRLRRGLDKLMPGRRLE